MTRFFAKAKEGQGSTLRFCSEYWQITADIEMNNTIFFSLKKLTIVLNFLSDEKCIIQNDGRT